MRFLRITFFIGLIGLGVIQFFPTDRNQNSTVLETDFVNIYNVPEDIQSILKNSCLDCHSNNTEYPWYSQIQPAGWLLENHIRDGKSELNFSEFGSYSKRKRRNKLRAITNQIKDEEMPLSSYTFIHRDAKLTDEEKSKIINWIESTIY